MTLWTQACCPDPWQEMGLWSPDSTLQWVVRIQLHKAEASPALWSLSRSPVMPSRPGSRPGWE